MRKLQNNLPFVSIIIPCRNEEKYIVGCLDSIIQQDYSKNKIEILVVDGMSEDKTRTIIENYKLKIKNLKLLDNHKKLTPFALNLGIRSAKGEYIFILGAHSAYSENYIKIAIHHFQKNKKIGAVGGNLINVFLTKTAKAKAIAHTLGSKFCVGPNKFRTGEKKQIFVDTVPFAGYKKEIFEEVGLFNEKFLKAQDLEFNMRIKGAGYKILLDPKIKTYYYSRDSFSKLFRMMFQYGYWKNFVNRELKIISSFRQLAPPLFIIYLISLILLYFLSPFFITPLLIYLFLVLFFGLAISINNKDVKMFPFYVLTFIITHIGYGLGYIKGFWGIWILKKKAFGKDQTGITR